MPKDGEAKLRGMQTVRVSKDSVLEKLKSNRDGHRAIFEEALDGYHKVVTEHLEQALADARANKQYTTYLALPEPQDHTRDYDRVIALVDMSLDKELELTLIEFSQYVLDDWGWKGDFIGTANIYNSH